MNTPSLAKDRIKKFGILLDPHWKEFFENFGGAIWLHKGYPMAHGGGRCVFLHRIISGAGDGQIVDHINGNPLDNREENLRICTQAENTRNSKKPVTNRSGVKGVSFDKISGKWASAIWCDNVRYRKKFRDFSKAVEYRKQLEERYFKEFRRE